MKSKFLISLLLSLLIFILSGCSLLNKRKINELNEALMELNQHTKIDYNFNISLTAKLVGSGDYQLGGINSNIKIDMNEENPKAIVDVDGLVTYFTDGYEIYLGEFYNDKYFVREKDLLEEESNTSIPEIKLNEIKYKFSVKEETRSKVYILTLKDDSLREIAEKCLGKTTIGYDMESKIKYYLDKETKSLKAYVMEFKFSNYSYKIYLNIEILIREVGDDVEIEIPKWVYTKIDEYIKDHEPQLPPDEPEEFIPETTLNTVS